MSYLRSNYMLETARRKLKEKGFQESEEIKNTPSSSTIDLIASNVEENRHLIFEFKRGPISTLDVARFHASISDVRLPGEKFAFIVTDAPYTASAESLSKKLKISLIKTDEKTVKQTMDNIFIEEQ